MPCGTPSCRGLITGGDWKLPELQERYAGFFSSYITRKIAQIGGHRALIGRLGQLAPRGSLVNWPAASFANTSV